MTALGFKKEKQYTGVFSWFLHVELLKGAVSLESLQGRGEKHKCQASSEWTDHQEPQGWGFHQVPATGKKYIKCTLKETKTELWNATFEKNQRCVLGNLPVRLKSQPPTFPQKCFLIILTTFQIAVSAKNSPIVLPLLSNHGEKSMSGEP